MEILDEDFAVPITVDQCKRGLGLGPDDTDHDDEIGALLTAATAFFETATDRPTVPRSMRFTLEPGDWSRWWCPVAPVREVESLEYRQEGGDWVALDLAPVDLRKAFDEPCLSIPSDYQASALGAVDMRVTLAVGYEAGKYPAQVRQALVLMVKDWLEAGLSTHETDHIKVSFGCRVIMRQLKYKRPRVALVEG